MHAQHIAILESEIEAHTHGFYTCAEIGVEPEIESFTRNVFETVSENDGAPSFEVTAEYVRNNWPRIVILCTKG